MKKLISLILLVLAAVCLFTACGLLPGDSKDVVIIEGGYLVVNGVKTEYKVDSDDVIEIVDGYLVVNGNKTEHMIYTEPVVSVIDGYVAVNGNKTEHQVKTEDVVEIIDGYVVINGVKTEIFVAECNHSWTRVTTKPTCKEGGYDTLTCALCGKSIRENETAKLEHSYATDYSFDDNQHWHKCTGCDAKGDIAVHSPDNDNNCSICGMPLEATPGVVYDISKDGTYAEVVGYSGTSAKVKIASEYKGLPVKNIFDNAFRDNTTVTSLIIPEGVTSIGSYAFYNTKLSSVAMPDSLVTISDYAFYRAELVSVVIPDGVVSIGNYAFAVDPMYYNWLLETVVIGNSVTTIGNYAFRGCRGITSLVIGEKVVTIGESAFSDCNKLTSITIPDSVTTIGSSAFSGCSGLTSIAIPDGVTTIGISTFENCTNLQNITLPDSVTNICRKAFSNCHSSIYTEYEYGKYVRVGNNPYAVLIEITNNNLST